MREGNFVRPLGGRHIRAWHACVCICVHTKQGTYNNIRRYCLHNISSHISSLLPRDKCFVQTFVHDKNTFIYVNVNIQPYLNTRLYE